MKILNLPCTWWCALLLYLHLSLKKKKKNFWNVILANMFDSVNSVWELKFWLISPKLALVIHGFLKLSRANF